MAGHWLEGRELTECSSFRKTTYRDSEYTFILLYVSSFLMINFHLTRGLLCGTLNKARDSLEIFDPIAATGNSEAELF